MKLRSSAPLPEPAVYEQEYSYWPWGDLIRRACDIVVRDAPRHANIFDYMCGTGYLISTVCERRPDINAEGCDIHLPFVEFGKKQHGHVTLHHEDARLLIPKISMDFILCTAGLHHLTFTDQDACLKKFADECDSNTTFILGEEVIPPYSTEIERRLAALRLNTDLISLGITGDWPAEMIEAAVEVTKNDILLRGEFKRDLKSWEEIVQKYFRIVETITTWKSSSGGGDVLFICKARQSAQ